MQEFYPIMKEAVPAFSLTKNFDWIPVYLETEKLMDAIQALKEKKSQINRAPSSIKDILAVAKEDYQIYADKRAKFLADRIARGNGRCLKFLNHTDLQPLVLWSEIEEAVKTYGKAVIDGISVDAKKNKIDKIDHEIAEIVTKLRRINDPKYFVIADNGEVTADRRSDFVQFWYGIQEKICEKCNFRGFRLSDSSDEEIKAYDLLGVARFLNKKARFEAYSG